MALPGRKHIEPVKKAAPPIEEERENRGRGTLRLNYPYHNETRLYYIDRRPRDPMPGAYPGDERPAHG